MGRSSLLGLYGSGERPAEPPTRSTLRPDPRGRTGLPNRSLDRSGMSPSTPSCSARLQRRRSWLIVGVGSKTQSGRSTGSCLTTTPKDSQMAWTDEGGHVRRSSSLTTRQRHLSAPISVTSSLSISSGTGRKAAAPARLTSSQYRSSRTGFTEPLSDRLRYEFLNTQLFTNTPEAQFIVVFSF
jgi:hypothetical protein